MTTSDQQLAVGNPEFEWMLRQEGQLGIFYSRANLADPIRLLPLRTQEVATSIKQTLYQVLIRLIRMEKKVEEDVQMIRTRADQIAEVLKKGVMICMYLKLRSVNMHFTDDGERYIPKPRVPDHLEIPKPFAIAVQQLGAVDIGNLIHRRIAVPTAADADIASMLMPAAADDNVRVSWNQFEYAQAVEDAKSLGMHFASVDQSVKVGSSWWLYDRTTDDGNIYRARMIVPESNYTETTAPLHLMFACDAHGMVASSVFQLGELDEGNFGYIIRNLPPFINVSTFFAYSDEPLKSYWKKI